MLLLRREEELLRTRSRIAELMRLYRRAQQPTATDLVEVVSGREAIALRWRQLQQGARRRLLVFDRSPHVALPDAELERSVLARGVRVRSVYETGGGGGPARLARIREQLAAGEEARLLPELPCKLAVVDDTWALLPVTAGAELASALLVRPSSLLDALIELFEAYWHRGVRLPDGRDAADKRGELLALLSAGFTDDSIARQLGVSARTGQRWVRELMDELGARTRFQAGLQATRAGLL
jgi:DNA-binding CsgD family transcriptional regulator